MDESEEEKRLKKLKRDAMDKLKQDEEFDDRPSKKRYEKDFDEEDFDV